MSAATDATLAAMAPFAVGGLTVPVIPSAASAPAQPAPKKTTTKKTAAAKSSETRVTAEAAVNSINFDFTDDEEEDEEAQAVLFQELARKTNCDALRRKIQRFLAEKTMTQTAFLSKIGVNSNSFRRFMQYKGAYRGSDNGTYESGLFFFHKLEKKLGTARGKGKAKGAAAAKGPSRGEKNAQAQELFDKIHVVTLEEPVYVYDDCDDIRKKLNELIASKRVTQAALLRELDVNSNSLRRFLTTKGKRDGCSNGVYMAAYCFFEKLRIAENKPKSGKRVKNEKEMPTGYSLERDPTHFWVLAGERF
ncbi:hypothetical protein Poli38472_001068 [Pythium oligandrum]|uniref:DUF7726 domain-containing protein n=1 Tax=Pythium oligandrum TaxID=41045 RepID=A0A8K1FRE3_PYTOL|nr:hypothetical protein Poli38472_001068 [Pythium oligandrum]|eukprot:TMW68912.1 hypothetical protein Poli38472_001068 [Pythium oligandrum]